MTGTAETRVGRLLDLAVDVAEEAGALIADRRQAGVDVAATKSSSVDVVTEADRASEALIRDRILTARPDDAFLGEEGDDVPGTSGVRWIVDPIDGTVNYLYGDAEYAVSIAAEQEGRIVAGVVLQPERERLFTASVGEGSFRNGHRLAVRAAAPLSQRLVLTGFGYLPEVRASQGRTVAALLPRVRDIRRRGACALDLCAVAAGEADGYVEEGPNPWDHAAGSLILTEAGGRFELAPGRAGSPVLIGAPRDGFEEFRQALDESGFLGNTSSR